MKEILSDKVIGQMKPVFFRLEHSADKIAGVVLDNPVQIGVKYHY